MGVGLTIKWLTQPVTLCVCKHGPVLKIIDFYFFSVVVGFHCCKTWCAFLCVWHLLLTFCQLVGNARLPGVTGESIGIRRGGGLFSDDSGSNSSVYSCSLFNFICFAIFYFSPICQRCSLLFWLKYLKVVIWTSLSHLSFYINLYFFPRIRSAAITMLFRVNFIKCMIIYENNYWKYQASLNASFWPRPLSDDTSVYHQVWRLHLVIRDCTLFCVKYNKMSNLL